MRVLNLHSGNMMGGVETLLCTLHECRSFTRGVEFHYALSFRAKLFERLAAGAARVQHIGAVRLSRPWTVRKARQLLAATLDQHDWNAVICHSVWAQLVFAPAVRRHSLPLFLWQHDAWTGRPMLERLAKRARPDFIIVNSHYSATTTDRVYPRAAREVLYYPVPTTRAETSSAQRETLRSQLGATPETVVIIQVSRLERWKGQIVLLEALSRLTTRRPWACWIVGGAQTAAEERYLQELTALAITFRIDSRVQFLGQRSDVAALLTASDIFCQPNTGPEPFGLALVEALQAGLPVATSAAGGAQEIVNDSCGILVRPGDHDALAAGLDRLIEEKSLRETLGRAGPARAQQLCDPRVQMPKLEEILRRARPTKPRIHS